jgi:hypothetical protein
MKMNQEIKGPFSYRNWKAALAGQSWQEMFEYPLFSDAEFIGEITEGLGPYQIINTVPVYSGPPPLVLRVQNHVEWKVPDMDKTDVGHYHGGGEVDEVAALLSLCLGVRMKAGSPNRIFHNDGDPKGTPIAWGYDYEPLLPSTQIRRGLWLLASARLKHSLEEASILKSVPFMSMKDMVALVRAARMYQEAVWIVEETPELSWLLLTSAVEIIAKRWKRKSSSPVERMRVANPELESLLCHYAKEGNEAELVEKVAKQIANYMGVAKKFIDFIIEFLPPEPPNRPPVAAQCSWDSEAMRIDMRKIYDYRSRALHDGIPFPLPLCEPPMFFREQEVCAEKFHSGAISSRGGIWKAEDLPMYLHMFEYIARNAILNWWKSVVPTGERGFS